MLMRRAGYDYGCVMVPVPAPLAARIRAFGKTIPEAALYYGDEPGRYGREQETHVTCKYGIHAKDVETVQRIVAGFGPVRVRLVGVSEFDAPTSDYTVLKVNVESEDLRRMHRLISDSTACTDSHPLYQPHVTIAYLRRDNSRPVGYLRYSTEEFNGQEFTAKTAIFSADDKKSRLTLARLAVAVKLDAQERVIAAAVAQSWLRSR